MEHPFTAYPKYLYHATLAPVTVYSAPDEAEARAKGYGDTYVKQEYPKHLHKEVLGGDGKPVLQFRDVANADDEAKAIAAGFSGDPVESEALVVEKSDPEDEA